jgi:hypothetical protein
MKWGFPILLAVAGIAGFIILDTLRLYEYAVSLQPVRPGEFPTIIFDDRPGLPQGLLHVLLIVMFAFWNNAHFGVRSRRRLIMWLLVGLGFTILVRVVACVLEDRFMWPIWETFIAQPARGG